MARYRKIDVRIWNDSKFSSLSDTAQLAFLFALTHPTMTPLGALRGSPESLAFDKYGFGEDSKALREAFVKAFIELVEKGLLKVDPRGLLFAVNFLKYNTPESPNVIKSWRGSIDYLPECELLKEVMKSAQARVSTMSEGYKKAFAEAFTEDFQSDIAKPMPKTMPNQEQEQEQEQIYNHNKQQTEICNEEPACESDVCFEDSIYEQADALALNQTTEVVSDPDAVVNPIQVMGLARMHGIKGQRDHELNELCAKGILTVDNTRQCIRIAKQSQKGWRYLIGVMKNAVYEPSQYHTDEYIRREREAFEARVDENKVFE